MGILKAWELEAKDAYETALAEAYDYCVDKPPTYTWDSSTNKYKETTAGVDSFPDITFLVWLSQAAASDTDLLAAINTLQDPDITAADIATLAKDRWDNKVKYLGSTQQTPPNGNATGLAQYIRDNRHTQNYNTLIPWDLEAGVKAALALNSYYPGADYDQQAIDIAEVIYACIDDTNSTYFNSTDTTQEEYVLGLTGGIEAFQEVNLHLDKAADLKTKLLAIQQAGGYWNYYGTTPATMSVQSTAYAVMALFEEGSADAISAANRAADWLVRNQKDDGGWFSEGGAGDEYPEIDSEAAWALAVLPAPVTIGTDGYYTIQSAVDAASEGDTINVAAGTYNENVVLPATKNLTLLGAQHDVNPGCEGARGDESILNGVSYASDKYGIAFPANPGTVVINGFTIKNYEYGIWGRASGTNVKGATISYNILENNGDPALPGASGWHDDGGALRIKNMDDSTITYNLVHNSERGIRLEDGTEGTETSDDNVISYNCIHDNQQYGIAIYYGGNNNTIEHNMVYNNADRGIQLTYATSTGNKINHNTVYNNCNDGILLQGGSNAEIKDNTVYNNAFTDQTWSGIYTDNNGPDSGFGYQPVHGGITVNYDGASGSNITISGNNVHDNGVLPTGQWSQWNNGKRSTTTADGIYVGANTTGATVNFNNIEDNQQYGVENLNTSVQLDATNN